MRNHRATDAHSATRSRRKAHAVDLVGRVGRPWSHRTTRSVFDFGWPGRAHGVLLGRASASLRLVAPETKRRWSGWSRNAGVSPPRFHRSAALPRAANLALGLATRRAT